MLIGLISGSGMPRWPGLEDERQGSAETAYGPVQLTYGRIGEVDVVQLCRHGPAHRSLSNQVDHKANLSALLSAGAQAAIGCTVCGSVDASVVPGSLVVFDYLQPNRAANPKEAARLKVIGDSLKALGEPLKTEFAPASLSSDLDRVGLRLLEDLAPPEIQKRYFHGRTDGYHASEHIHFALAAVK